MIVRHAFEMRWNTAKRRRIIVPAIIDNAFLTVVWIADHSDSVFVQGNIRNQVLKKLSEE